MKTIPWEKSISRATVGQVRVCSNEITKEHEWAGLEMLGVIIAVVCQRCAYTPMEILEKYLIIRDKA